jgi:dTMP kinase
MDAELLFSHRSVDASHRRALNGEAIRINGTGAVDISKYPGRLIAIEGTDGAGRSTQIALLREWLETQGFGVSHTALTRSRLVGAGLRKAKQGTTLGQLTLDLFYATDFADRLENDILPALRAGFVVLTDRYIYSVMARSIVRGIDPDWIRDLYRFAPHPHGVLYLDIQAPNLVPRVLNRGGFDYWESGLDFQEERDLYRSFVRYQSRLLEVFGQLAVDYRFEFVDANRGIGEVFHDLRDRVLRLVACMRSSTP